MFHFVANLKPYLVAPPGRSQRFRGFLVSVDYIGSLKKLSSKVLSSKRFLVADNGNVDLIVAHTRSFKARADVLHEKRKREEKTLRRYARPNDLSVPLRDAYRALAEDIAGTVTDAVQEARLKQTVALQNSTQALYMIGMEELTMAVMSGVGIAPEYVSLPLDWYARSSRSAVDLAARTRLGEFATNPRDVFAGLHGVDFDTARQAGKLAALSGIEGIASGLAGPLGDRTHVDFRCEDGKVQALEEPMARPYLRVADIAAGLHLGYAETSGRRLRFHALGAGSPILLPMLAALGDRRTYMAADSTAPIVDAYSSATISLYVDKPAPLKLKAHRVVEVWLDNGRGWDCGCPFCRAFLAQHPFQLDAARDWWRGAGRRRLTETDVRAPSPLAECVPLLGASADARIRSAAGMARIHHNHWILQRLERKAQALASEPAKLRDWAASTVEAYVRAAADPEWKAATRAAWSVIERTALRIDGADPGGELDPV